MVRGCGRPGCTLATSVVGYADYLDEDGRWAGRTDASSSAVFVRAGPCNLSQPTPIALIVQVLVTTGFGRERTRRRFLAYQNGFGISLGQRVDRKR
jgi:hypothetical protein